MLVWCKRELLRFKKIDSNRSLRCESESYRISEQPEIMQMAADEYVWLCCNVCDDVRSLWDKKRHAGDTFCVYMLQRRRVGVCAGDNIIIKKRNKNRQRSALSFNATHCVIWWMLSRQCDTILCRMPWKNIHYAMFNVAQWYAWGAFAMKLHLRYVWIPVLAARAQS